MDDQKWILRNSVIWNKHKGGLDSSKDKLRNIHENIFHFVKDEKNISTMLQASVLKQESQS